MPYVDFNWLNENELAYLSANGAFAKILIPNFIFHFIFAFWLIALVGMFFYINAARNLFIALVLFTILLTPFIGFVSLSPIESTLLEVLNIIDGVLIAMILFTSVSDNFKNRLTRRLTRTAAAQPLG